MRRAFFDRPWNSQPQGPADINFGDSLTDGLAFLIVHGPGGSRELVRSLSMASGTTSHGVSAAGAGTKYTAAGVWNSNALTTSNGVGTGDFTLLSYSAPVAEADATALLSSCAGVAAQQAYLLANTDAGFGASSGTLAFGDTNLISGASVVDGGLHAFVGVRQTATGYIDRDGVQVATGALSSGSIWAAGCVLQVQGINGYSGWTSASPGVQLIEAGWNRALSLDERRRVGRNPWLLFAPRRIFVPGASSGAVSHTSTGALVADAAVVAGTATDVATFTGTGALAAQAATVAGTATHLTLHSSTGALAADAATVAGSANHINVHGSTGALAADAATVAGSAQHTAPGSFTSTGALAADVAVVAGTATHLTLHTSTGALSASAATVAGVAVHSGPGSVVDEPAQTGAGRARRVKRHRYVVEIDGEEMLVDSPEEAEALLQKARELAQAVADKAIQRAAQAKRRPVAKVLRDARQALKVPAVKAPPEMADYAERFIADIQDLYASTMRTIEVSALLNKRQRQEDDDEDVLLLIA